MGSLKFSDPSAVSTLEWLTARPIAHRGYHDLNNSVWENTPTAFERAIQAGYNIECDLQFASDGVPVVFHDYATDRLCGFEGTVRELSSRSLASHTVGSSSDHIPTLKGLIRQVKDRAGLVIELKPQSESVTAAFAKAVLDDLGGYKGRVALMSFDEKLILELMAFQSPWPVGLTAYAHTGSHPDPNEEMIASGIRFVSFNVSDLPDPFIEKARKTGMPVITWTVRNKTEMDLTYRYADQITFEGFDPAEMETQE